MTALGPHAGYILAAFGLGVASLVALAAHIVLTHRRLTATLKALEERGLTRRPGSNL